MQASDSDANITLLFFYFFILSRDEKNSHRGPIFHILSTHFFSVHFPFLSPRSGGLFFRTVSTFSTLPISANSYQKWCGVIYLIMYSKGSTKSHLLSLVPLSISFLLLLHSIILLLFLFQLSFIHSSFSHSSFNYPSLNPSSIHLSLIPLSIIFLLFLHPIIPPSPTLIYHSSFSYDPGPFSLFLSVSRLFHWMLPLLPLLYSPAPHASPPSFPHSDPSLFSTLHT